jgi:anaphase-promoting complex subunit 6
VFNLELISADPNDAFWLAQTYFLTGHYLRAERILTRPLPPALRRDSNPHLNGVGHGKGKGREDDAQLEEVLGRREEFGDLRDGEKLSALVDQSLPCLYLVAQCLVRHLCGMWRLMEGTSGEIYSGS